MTHAFVKTQVVGEVQMMLTLKRKRKRLLYNKFVVTITVVKGIGILWQLSHRTEDPCTPNICKREEINLDQDQLQHHYSVFYYSQPYGTIPYLNYVALYIIHTIH